MNTPKVLVGCPTAVYKKYCLEAHSKGIMSLTYPNYEIMIVDNSPTPEYAEEIKKSLQDSKVPVQVIRDEWKSESARERITHSRNIIRERAVKEQFEYFFSLEQDVIPPPDVIEKLLLQQRKILTGVYFTKYQEGNQRVMKPLLWKKPEQGKLEFIDEEKINGSLIRVDAAGLGCMMIQREILEKIPFRLFTEKNTFDDMPFCFDLNKNKIPVYADTSLICKHMIEGMDWESIKE